MKDLWDLYLRYDGPVPRALTHTTSPVCWELLLRGHLRAIRLKRHNEEWDDLPELTERVRQIRVYLCAPVV